MNDKQPKSSRNCPALAKTITPKECGSDRVSKINCPPTCEFHPFTPDNTESLLAVEERLLKKVQQRVLGELRGDLARDLGRRLRECEDEVEHFLMLMQAVHAESEVEGPDFVDRWAKDHFDGLNNDERVILKAQQTQRPALLHVQKVTDSQTMDVLDLLSATPEPFSVVSDFELDSAMEGDAMLGWIYDAPLFIRLSGPAFEVPHGEEETPIEALREAARKLGAPALSDHLRHWLKTHALEVYQSLDFEDEDVPPSAEYLLGSIDWESLPDFSEDKLPRQQELQVEEIDKRLASFLRQHPPGEENMDWFEATWLDIASGADQVTEDGTLSDEAFGVVLMLLVKAAGVLHPRPPKRDASSQRFLWRVGRELAEAVASASEDADEGSYERYLLDSPQPAVCDWLCGEAASLTEGDEALVAPHELALIFPILKAAVWEMCHWPVV